MESYQTMKGYISIRKKQMFHLYPVFSVGHFLLLGLIKHILVSGSQGLFEIYKHGVWVSQSRKCVRWNSTVNSLVNGNNGSMH